MQKEICEASGRVSEEVKGLQTQPRYWSGGEKRTLRMSTAVLHQTSKDECDY